MSWLGINPQILGRCSSCLASQVPVAPVMRTNVLYRHGLRYASTAAKPRAKKTDSAASDLAGVVAKKKISTKTAAPTVAKPRGRKKAEPSTESALSDAPAPVAKKTTRSASTKSTAAAAKKKNAELDAAEDKPASSRAKTAAATRARKSAAAAATQPAPTPTPQPLSPTPKTPEPAKFTDKAAQPGVTGTSASNAPQPPPPETMAPPSEPIKVVDTSSPDYKRAARKYTSVMVALPILLVTSYFLFDRRELHQLPGPPISILTSFYSCTRE